MKGTWGRALAWNPRPRVVRWPRPAGAAARAGGDLPRTCSTCHALPPPDTAAEVGLEMGRARHDRPHRRGDVGCPRRQSAASPLDFDVEQIAYYYETGRAPRAAVARALARAGQPTPRASCATASTLAGAASDRPRRQRPAPRAADRGRRPEVVAVDMLAGPVLGSARPQAGSPGAARARSPGEPGALHVAAVDLDRDGRTDLLVADLGEAGPATRRTAASSGCVPDAEGRGVRPTRSRWPPACPRVADVQAADFDGDGDLDLIVAAFGWRRVGGILLLENRTTDWTQPVFVPHLARHAHGRHPRARGRPRRGRPTWTSWPSSRSSTRRWSPSSATARAGFREETIDPRPHPAWGSSGIQLVDLDGDGDLDVLVTNGDMLDDFQLKPYHGIRWLENRGRFPFVPHDVAPFFGALAGPGRGPRRRRRHGRRGLLARPARAHGAEPRAVARPPVAGVARADRARPFRAPHPRDGRPPPQPRPRATRTATATSTSWSRTRSRGRRDSWRCGRTAAAADRRFQRFTLTVRRRVWFRSRPI